MNHALLDSRKEHWLCIRIWPASPNCGIYIFRRDELLTRCQKDEEMNVGEAPFLELNCVYISHHAPENTAFVDVLDDCLFFEVEDAGHQIRPICRLLARKKFPSDFRPVGICGARNEEVDRAKVASDGHRVLEALTHVTWTANVAGWQNNPLSDLVEVKVIISSVKSILEPVIQGRPEQGLVHAQKPQTILISRRPHVNHVALEKSASPQDSRRLILSLMKAEGDISGLGKPCGMILVGLVQLEVRMPAALAAREKENIVERGVRSMQITDSHERPSTPPKNDIARLCLRLVSGEDHRDLICSRKIAAPGVGAGGDAQPHRVIFRIVCEVSEDLVRMPEEMGILVVVSDDCLKCLHRIRRRVGLLTMRYSRAARGSCI
jgi:hypothetical protein